MMSRSEDNFWSGLKVLFFLLVMLIVFGTVGHVEMTGPCGLVTSR